MTEAATSASSRYEDSWKKRRFSAFISNNYNQNAQNKRPSPEVTRVMLVGRPHSGKSSIASMLMNRDVSPGWNPGGIVITDSTCYREPASPSNDVDVNELYDEDEEICELHHDQDEADTQTTTSTTTTSTTTTNTSSTPTTATATTSTPAKLLDDLPIARPRGMTGGPPMYSLNTPSPSSHPDNTPNDLPHIQVHKKATIYRSDKYVITDVDGFQTGTDMVGTILELRRWLEDNQQGYHIILMVIKAKELTDTDRTVFALCSALLHDLKDLVHIVVTGCDTNSHWIQENAFDLKRTYNTLKTVGVAFPTTSAGLLGCIFEEMRKESLIVLEDYISKNCSTAERVPRRSTTRGGSAGSNTANSRKFKALRTKSRSFSNLSCLADSSAGFD
jgi:GTP-binding protein EngB required for normal cell division